MSVTNQTRTLLGPADPARGAVAEPPRLTAAELIARAAAAPEAAIDAGAPRSPGRAPDRRSTGRRRPAAPRRLVLAAAVLLALATGAALLRPLLIQSTVDDGGGPRQPVVLGPVIAPIAYQVDHNPPAAASRLRALAGRLAAAPYEDQTGRYAHHKVQEWGDPQMTDASGRYVMGFVSVVETWMLADGSGRNRSTSLPPEFPDRASRNFYAQHPDLGRGRPVNDFPLIPDTRPRTVPPDPAGLAALLDARYGCTAAAKQVATVYTRYALATPSRAAVLDVLAGVPGFRWRGQASDRAGRTGVAITCDDPRHDEQSLLIFDGRTGVLLAQEMVVLHPKKVSAYLVLLDTGRTDRAR